MSDFAIGNVQVSRIEEMLSPAAQAKAFFREYSEAEFKPHEHWLSPRFYQPDSGKLIISNHSWLLRTDHHVILIDSCAGNHKPRPEMARYDMLNTNYLDRLKAAGAEPDDVDFVLCTHLHVDHVGWNTRLANGRWVPTFRNAKYVMSRFEHDYWANKAQDPGTMQAIKNVYSDSVLPIVEKGMAVMFDETYELDNCLTLRPAPGHTPGHIRIDLESRERKAIICGDVLHSPVQVPLWKWNTIFCEDPVQAAKTRHDVLSTCVESGALLMPMHFAQPHAAYINAHNDSFDLNFDHQN